MRNPVWLLIILLLGLTLAPAGEAAGGRGRHGGPGVRFVDQDGDGFNDLAPDTDHDGIPDCVDPDQTQLNVASPRQGRGRHGRPWQINQARPDSLVRDSLLYIGWWERRGRHGWGPAWQQWQGGSAGAACPWDNDPLAPGPRGGRFLNDPTGRPGSGGGNGNGGGGGGGGNGPGGH